MCWLTSRLSPETSSNRAVASEDTANTSLEMGLSATLMVAAQAEGLVNVNTTQM